MQDPLLSLPQDFQLYPTQVHHRTKNSSWMLYHHKQATTHTRSVSFLSRSVTTLILTANSDSLLSTQSPGDTQYYRDGSPSFHGYTICTHTALPGLLRALAQYNLCTTVRISSEKNLWSQINAHAQDFLPKKSIVLVSPRHDLDAEASAWELRGWDLLAFRGPNPATNRQLTIHGAMGRQWTFAELSKVAKRCIHPDFDHIELLFVGQ